MKTDAEQEKPVGYEVTVLYGIPVREETFHWRGTEAAVRRKAIFKSHFQRVTAVRPITREQWRRAYGDPSLRERMGRS